MPHIQLLGGPCAQKGPYTFYKALKYNKDGVSNVLCVNDFFFVKLWTDSDLISVAELRLLWQDKLNGDKAFASLRLYILPENTPEGRLNHMHGEDEVLAITEKVVIKLDDLLTWIVETSAKDFNWDLGTDWQQRTPLAIGEVVSPSLADCSGVDNADIAKEKHALELVNWERRTGVVVLSYSRYCRFRGLLRRFEGLAEDVWLKNASIAAVLGGVYATSRITKVLYCRDTFDYPDLEGHESLCNHLAPKLRTKIPKKKNAYYFTTDGSDGGESEGTTTSSDSNRTSSPVSSREYESGGSNSNGTSRQKITVPTKTPATIQADKNMEAAFYKQLHTFMKARGTPIEMIPAIGYNEINLYQFFMKVKELGGSEKVAMDKKWKYVFADLGGDVNNTAAAEIAETHFARYLQPFEEFVKIWEKAPADPQDKAWCMGGVSQTSHSRRKAQPVKYVSELSGASIGKKPGDKENYNPPKGGKKVVIDLCSPEKGGSIGGGESSGTASVSGGGGGENKKRKLDILREGGLEVTPITSSVDIIAGKPPDVVTLTRRLAGVGTTTSTTTPAAAAAVNDNKISITITPDTTFPQPRVVYGNPKGEPLDLGKKYGGQLKQQKLQQQQQQQQQKLVQKQQQKGKGALDLTVKHNAAVDNAVKRFTSNLGPNIEISLVPAASTPTWRKKSAKTVPLPMPALKKITAGEITLLPAGKRSSKRVKPHVTMTETTAVAATGNNGTVLESGDSLMNHPSLYLAALYNNYGNLLPGFGNVPMAAAAVTDAYMRHVQQQQQWSKEPFRQAGSGGQSSSK